MQDIHCVLSMKNVYDEIEYGNVNNAVELLENILKCSGINMIKQEKADKRGKKWFLGGIRNYSILSFVETKHYACREI